MEAKPIIFFDGACNFCNNSVQFVIKNDTKEYFSFSSLQSDYAKKILSPIYPNFINENTLILLSNNEIYTKSTAVLHIARHLRFPFYIGYIFIIIPNFIRNFIYDIIAKNRHRLMRKNNSCAIPTQSLKNRFIE